MTCHDTLDNSTYCCLRGIDSAIVKYLAMTPCNIITGPMTHKAVSVVCIALLQVVCRVSVFTTCIEKHVQHMLYIFLLKKYVEYIAVRIFQIIM